MDRRHDIEERKVYARELGSPTSNTIHGLPFEELL